MQLASWNNSDHAGTTSCTSLLALVCIDAIPPLRMWTRPSVAEPLAPRGVPNMGPASLTHTAMLTEGGLGWGGVGGGGLVGPFAGWGGGCRHRISSGPQLRDSAPLNSCTAAAHCSRAELHGQCRKDSRASMLSMGKQRCFLPAACCGVHAGLPPPALRRPCFAYDIRASASAPRHGAT